MTQTDLEVHCSIELQGMPDWKLGKCKRHKIDGCLACDEQEFRAVVTLAEGQGWQWTIESQPQPWMHTHNMWRFDVTRTGYIPREAVIELVCYGKSFNGERSTFRDYCRVLEPQGVYADGGLRVKVRRLYPSEMGRIPT